MEHIKTYLALLPLIVCLGCNSGDIGLVSGTVTADGKPVPKAMVTFYPRPEGRASMGMTDENGDYELTYTRDQMGAKVGEHKVHITTAIEGGDYGTSLAKETLPAKYNVDSELKADVALGSNDLDFDLDYNGQIIQGGY